MGIASWEPVVGLFLALVFATHPRTIDRVNRLRALRCVAPLDGDDSITEDLE
jgi:Zn-dependent protease with chaperone function